jgi:hypothetical protein
VVTVEHIARYWKRYIETYQREYQRFTSEPPLGGGFPDILNSPYLYSPEFTCHVASDGTAIADTGYQPPNNWRESGEESVFVRTIGEHEIPAYLVQPYRLLQRNGKAYDILSVLAETGEDVSIWTGKLPEPTATSEIYTASETKILVSAFNITLKELVARLTFNCISRTPDPTHDFWKPLVTSHIGMVAPDGIQTRYH